MDGSRSWDRVGFVAASCAAPAVNLVTLGLLSLEQPMKLFGPACVPIYLAIWAALAYGSYRGAHAYASWARGQTAQESRSLNMALLVGFAQGYAVAAGGYWLQSLVAVVGLGPVLFRSQASAPLGGHGASGMDADELRDELGDEPVDAD